MVKAAHTRIEDLREQVVRARKGNLGEEASAFWKLLEHPDAQWRDAVSGLSRPGLEETAALQFYRQLRIGRSRMEIETDPRVWKEFLEASGLKLSDKMALSELPDTMVLLEFLAGRGCVLMPPWIYVLNPGGRLSKLAPAAMDSAGNLDQGAILLAVLRRAPKAAARGARRNLETNLNVGR